MMIVRIGSHRANAKLRQAVPEMVEVYENSFSKPGYFAIVSEEESAKALAITGISKVRDQDESHYSKTWSHSEKESQSWAFPGVVSTWPIEGDE